MDANDQQITDRIAVEVMGYEIIEEAGQPAFVEMRGNDRITRRWKFNPLHDHNHAALVRKKMRERGYSFSRDDVTNRDGSLFFEGPHEVTIGKAGMFVCSVADKDELMAEALAILAALDANGKDK